MSESTSDRVVLVMLRASVMGSLLELETAKALPAVAVVPAQRGEAAVKTGARSQSMRTKTGS